ncbi:endochitinase [Scenedesmus sp. PABB004]|nr:endochitinase [Scenedesmus sp. PABB004]
MGVARFSLLALLPLLALPGALGHGWLSRPESRNSRLNAVAPPGIAWDRNSGNGRGLSRDASSPGGIAQPGVCGDPWQNLRDPANANWMAAQVQSPSATYAPGSRVSLQWTITTNHGGWIGFKICDRNTNLDQACFDRFPLQRADGLGRHTFIQTVNGMAGGPCASSGVCSPSLVMSQDYIIPAGISCPNGCVLQWEYHTYNSCWGGCENRAACGGYATPGSNPALRQTSLPVCSATVRTERFHNCADIRVIGTPPPPPPPSSPSPPPPPPPPCVRVAAPGGQCGATSGGACCPSGQCCGQYGWCGVTSDHCGIGCQPLVGKCGSTPSPPPPPPPPPPVPSPPTCVDTYAACPGWGVGSCGLPGVKDFCPCMCRTGARAAASDGATGATNTRRRRRVRGAAAATAVALSPELDTPASSPELAGGAAATAATVAEPQAAVVPDAATAPTHNGAAVPAAEAASAVTPVAEAVAAEAVAAEAVAAEVVPTAAEGAEAATQAAPELSP